MADTEMIKVIIISFTFLTVSGLLTILWYRLRYYRQQSIKKVITAGMLQGMSEQHIRLLLRIIRKHPRQALMAFMELSQSLSFHDPYSKTLLKLIKTANLSPEFTRNLASSKVYKRIEAAVFLGYLNEPETLAALENALMSEKDARVKLYIANALADRKSASSIPVMVASLFGEKNWYRTRVNMLLASYGAAFLEYVPQIIKRQEVEIQSLLVDFASVQPAELMKEYLGTRLDSPHRDITYRAVRVLGEHYPLEVSKTVYYRNDDPVIRNIAIQALANLPERHVIDKLVPLFIDDKCIESLIVTLSEIARKQPVFVEYLISMFKAEAHVKIRAGLAQVLSNRIEYILIKQLADKSGTMKELVTSIITQGKFNGIISFLNRNKNKEMEDAVVELLLPIVTKSKTAAEEFSRYLQPAKLKQLNLIPHKNEQSRHEYVDAAEKKSFLIILLIIAAGIAPVFYLLIHINELKVWTWYQHSIQYVLDFNYGVAYYSLAINSIYIALLLLSFHAANSQMKLWQLKKNKFLFKPRILPGISIIAPAYCEEATIVESVNSLLNLRYVNYELIVVNDGSSDETLSKLIQAFNLEKIDKVLPSRIKSGKIMGIYANKLVPRLLVIDKVNGGKADALNAGLNLSNKEYICGIDADSLIESDSLLKLMSLTLDSPHESVALGGNILPVNGCTIHRGMLENIGIPRSQLARFQTIEYIRAFMAGRLGWAKCDCLLIISGAFGLFQRDRVLEVGGYLTSKERYGLDTVGEDMELVVRLERKMLELKQSFKVLYSYNSNCWTEVPETFNVLFRQRDRWQRGLIDVIHFHKKMFFNHNYREIGLIAVPYFVIFELLGPLIEFQGYMMVVLAAVLGIMNLKLAVLLFTASILYGVVISICSLLITAKDTQYFSNKEIVLLIVYAVLENFGMRQILSFIRIVGFINALRAKRAWGTMTRKGFKSTNGTQVSNY